MNHAVFRKTMKNVRRYRDVKLVTTESRKSYEVSEANCHSTKITESLLAIKMRKTQILMNKPFYLVLSVLKLSKTVMHEFWYHYVKSKYGKNAKLCYIVTDSLCLCKKQMFIKML